MSDSYNYIQEKSKMLYEGTVKELNIVDLFEELFKKHAEYIRIELTKFYNKERERFTSLFSQKELEDRQNAIQAFGAQLSTDLYIWQKVAINKHPDKEEKIKEEIKIINRSISWDKNNKKDNFIREYGIYSVDNYVQFWSQFYYKIFDETTFNSSVQKIIEENIIYNEHKLKKAIKEKLSGLSVKTVKELYSRIGKQGIEGSFEIELSDGTVGSMSTNSIYAGGYNIQVLHYRYLIKLSANLVAKKIDAPVEISPEEKEVINILKTNVPKDWDITKPIILTGIWELKGSSRRLSPMIKKGYIRKGQSYGKYYITQSGLEFLNNNN